MALYLLRHGALPPNPQRRFVGQRDLPLSPRGQRQIAFWAKELAVTPLKAIFCSSLQRCRESARSIGRYHPQTPVIPRDAFREIHLGQWEGLTPAEVEERFPGAYAARGRNLADYCPQGGESFRMLARRVLPALRDILPQNNDDNTIFKDLIFEGSFSVEETTQRLSLSFDGVTHKWDGDKYFTVQYGYYDKESQELNVHLFYEYHSGKEKSFTRTFQRIK